MRLLGEPLTAEERITVVATARSFVGLPWRHQGRTVRGMDCIGMADLALASVRPMSRARTDYGRLPSNGKLRASLIETLGEPVTGEPQFCDLVTMKWAGEEHHLALVVDHPAYPYGLIHASNLDQRVIEHGADPQWRRRIVDVFRP